MTTADDSISTPNLGDPGLSAEVLPLIEEATVQMLNALKPLQVLASLGVARSWAAGPLPPCRRRR
jgi:hypothetical protein